VNDYPFVTEIEVRWRDLDPYEHVNHAAVATYLETARSVLWRELCVGHTLHETPIFVTRLEIEYRRPIGFDDRVRLGVRACAIRGASFVFEYRLEASDRLAAVGRTTHACVDPESGRPTRVPPWFREVLESVALPDPS
jgi:acyl-CoA thioester hydrolase